MQLCGFLSCFNQKNFAMKDPIHSVEVSTGVFKQQTLIHREEAKGKKNYFKQTTLNKISQTNTFQHFLMVIFASSSKVSGGHH